MDAQLRAEFMNAAIRFKKAGMPAPKGNPIRTGEVFVLERISENSVSMTEIQSSLFMTKPAVSQILNSLERRGLIRREIDPSDRRRIMVTLTGSGKRFIAAKRNEMDCMLDRILDRLGEENTREFIRLLNILADISEEIKREAERPAALDDLKGDKPID